MSGHHLSAAAADDDDPPCHFSYLRQFSLVVAGLRAPLSRFLEGAPYKYSE